ncbi:MAG: protein kinase domain-containing protein [Pseudomonadota bacterium]|jgi:serine/threonine protein kinase
MEQHQHSASAPYLAPGYLVAGRYRIVRTLGAGGMASVYLADDEVLGETRVALKILKSSKKLTEAGAERFLREVRLTHKINHENVVRTYDFGKDGEARFYTMEYLSGKTLTMLAEEEVLPISTILRIAVQVCRGLAAIHSVGVIHRDLKPDNIMVVDALRVKITDFGVARNDGSMLTIASDEIVGTIAYLAPETLMGKKATNAVDYYSFAAVLYELLTGHLPIEDEHPARVIMRKIDEVPQDPRVFRADIPDWLAEGVVALLNPNPDARMEAVKVFVQDLVAHAPQEQAGDLITASLGVQISELPTTVMDRPTIIGRLKPVWAQALSWQRVLMAFVIALIAIPVCSSDLGKRIDYQQLDNLFVARGAQPPSDDLVIVSIDEPSYLNLQVPMGEAWPRALHAKLIDTLQRNGARRIVFDVLFLNPSVDPAADQQFADALGRVPTVLGASIGVSQQATANGSFMLEQMMRPLPQFEARAAEIGLVGLPQEFGRIWSFHTERSELFPEIGSLAKAASGVGAAIKQPGKRDLINHYGPASTIRRFSYYDVISDEQRIPSETFKDKIVFVGLNLQSRTGPSQREAFTTPYDTNVFGTELHATATSNMLKGDWIARPSPYIDWLVWGALVMATVLVTSCLNGLGALFILSCITLSSLAIEYWLFLSGLYVPIVSALGIGIFIGLLLRVGLSQTVTTRARRWTQS